ncbi:MAG: MFS transporter [Steroidobacteraceae bacterium]
MNASTLKQPPGERRQAGTSQALVLILANVLPTMGIVSLVPILPQLFAQFRDFPQAGFWVPTIITAPSVCIALLSPVVGGIADRVGRRTLFLAALAAYTVVGSAPLLLDSLPAILASRVLLGIAEAIIYTTVNTLMGDYFHGETRRKWLSYQNAVGSLLATVLIVAGGILGAMSWRGPFLLYLLSLPIFLAAWVLTWEPEPQAEDLLAAAPGEPVPFPWRTMAFVCALTLISAVVFFLQPLQTGVVMNAIGLGRPDLIGIVSAGTGFALPLGAWLFGRNKRWRFGQFLTLAYALFAAGLYTLGSASTLLTVVIGACLAQFACGITFPLLTTWCQGKLQFEVRARGMGLWISTFFLGQFLSTSTVALLSAPAGGIGGVMRWAGLFCVPAAVIALLGDWRTTARQTP